MESIYGKTNTTSVVIPGPLAAGTFNCSVWTVNKRGSGTSTKSSKKPALSNTVEIPAFGTFVSVLLMVISRHRVVFVELIHYHVDVIFLI